MPALDYHSRVTEVYQGTLDALRARDLTAEMIDTGGSCKAISVTGTTARPLDEVYVMLTAGGPLTDERDPDTHWEIGTYDDRGEHAGVGVIDSSLADQPAYDAALADEVAQLVAVLRPARVVGGELLDTVEQLGADAIRAGAPDADEVGHHGYSEVAVDAITNIMHAVADHYGHNGWAVAIRTLRDAEDRYRAGAEMTARRTTR